MPLLVHLAEMVRDKKVIHSGDLEILLLGIDTEDSEAALVELQRWATILQRVASAGPEARSVGQRALQQRTIPEAAAILAINLLFQVVSPVASTTIPISFEPAALTFGTVPADRPAVRELTVRGGPGTVKPGSSRIVVSADSFGPDVTTLSVSLTPGQPDESLWDRLTLTAGGQAHTIDITARWVKPDANSLPAWTGKTTAPDLQALGLLHTIWRGKICSMHLYGPQEVLVVSTGGACVLDVDSGMVSAEIEQFCECGDWAPKVGILALGWKDQVSLWDVCKGIPANEPVRTSTGSSLVLLPDREMVIRGPNRTDQPIRLVRTDIDAPTGELLGYQSIVDCLAQAPDGRTLASAGSGAVHLWDLDERRHRYSLKCNKPLSLAFNSSGTLLAIGDADGSIRLWEVETGSVRRTLKDKADFVHALAFDSTGKRLATAVGNLILVWDGSGAVRHRLAAHRGWVRSLMFLADGRLVSGGEDGRIRIWNIDASKEEACWLRWNEWDDVSELCPCFSPTGSRIAYLDQDFRLQIADTADGGLVFSAPPSLQFDSGWALNSDGRFLVCWDEGAPVSVWNLEYATMVRQFADPGFQMTCAAFDPSSRLLAFGGEEGHISVYGIEDEDGGEYLSLHFKDEGATPRVLAFSPDGRFLAAAQYDGQILLCYRANGKRERTMSSPLLDGEEIHGLAFSAKGDRLLAWGKNVGGSVWTILGTELGSYQSHSILQAAAFHPEGNLIAWGEKFGAICLWDCRSGKELRRFNLPGKRILGLTFSEDGKRLYTASDAVRIWNLEKLLACP